MNNVPAKFLDWVKAEILASGKLTSEEVFDQREKSIYWIIDKSLTEGLGAACSIALPSLRKVDTPAPDTLQEMTCQVSIASSVLADDRDMYTAALALYSRFSAARFYPAAENPARFSPNVSADNFASSGDSKTGFLFTFNVTARTRI